MSTNFKSVQIFKKKKDNSNSNINVLKHPVIEKVFIFYKYPSFFSPEMVADKGYQPRNG